MRILVTLLCVGVLLQCCLSLPVTKDKKKEEKQKEEEAQAHEKVAEDKLEDTLEYKRYLKEVVQLLENDSKFKEKLEAAHPDNIRNGGIADELELVSHHVRNQLDEVKRRELDRLRELANKQYELTNEIDRDHLKVADHVDHSNQHTFEVEDLKKLILKAAQDLDEADKKRREEFKQYEMQKEFEKEQVLKELSDEDKKRYEAELKANQEKHNKHEPLHHPGHKAQLEEVWEEQDHMTQEFDPKTFFMLHDLDSNGFWDATEVKALFVKELDKVYQSGMKEDDMRERAEEMERMREHVFKEADKNKDGLISYEEFVDQTKKEEFNRDPSWDTVDNAPQYTHDEYLQYQRKREEEIQRLIANGQLPPHPNMPNGYYPNGQYPQGHAPQYHPNGAPNQPHYQQQPHHPNAQYHPPPHYDPHYPQQQYHPQQGQGGHQVPVHQQQQQQYHPGQGQYQQPPPGHQQQHPNAVPPHNQQPYQPPPGQQAHPNAVPQQQQYHPQQPVQQQHPNAVPPQNQPPPGQQPHANAVPQPNQPQPNAVPVQLNQNEVYNTVNQAGQPVGPSQGNPPVHQENAVPQQNPQQNANPQVNQGKH